MITRESGFYYVERDFSFFLILCLLLGKPSPLTMEGERVQFPFPLQILTLLYANSSLLMQGCSYGENRVTTGRENEERNCLFVLIGFSFSSYRFIDLVSCILSRKEFCLVSGTSQS